jgi:hypothetical protein
MIDDLLNRTTTNMNQHRTTQDSSSNRYTSQVSFSTNVSVASSTTNNSASNPNHSKDAMLTLQRQVRIHHTTDALVWMDEQNDDEYYYNANKRIR